GEEFTIDAEYVDQNMKEVISDEDLTRYIL
ncbi:unnamed protein product, partial [marine sediment metagenome]